MLPELGQQTHGPFEKGVTTRSVATRRGER